MKKIYFISSYQTIPNYFINPIILNKKKLQTFNYKIKIIRSIKNIDKYNIDTLCILSKPLINILNEKEWIFKDNGPVITFLKYIKLKVDKIIWLDDSDSSSVTHFEVMPYVDLYLKKQLLKDRNLYKINYYGGRIFTDFYKKNFNILDQSPLKKQEKLKDEFINKLNVSWNIGLGDTQNSFKLINYFKRYLPELFKSNYKYMFTHGNIERPIDIFLRTSANLSRETIAFHRKKFVSDLQSLIKKNNYYGIVNDFYKISDLINNKKIKNISSKISNYEYRYLTRLTKIMPSPFGWGEIGARDFEAFINGCLIIKPNIDYMETWPNFFISNKTYVDCKLDFSDIEYKIAYYLKNDEKRNLIVDNAQKLLREIFSQNGMDKFC